MAAPHWQYFWKRHCFHSKQRFYSTGRLVPHMQPTVWKPGGQVVILGSDVYRWWSSVLPNTNRVWLIWYFTCTIKGCESHRMKTGFVCAQAINCSITCQLNWVRGQSSPSCGYLPHTEASSMKPTNSPFQSHFSAYTGSTGHSPVRGTERRVDTCEAASSM